MRTIDAHLVHGDFYAEECIAAVAWPLLVQAGGLAARKRNVVYSCGALVHAEPW